VHVGALNLKVLHEEMKGFPEVSGNPYDFQETHNEIVSM